MRCKRPWLKREKPREKTREEILEIAESECRHYIIAELLSEDTVNEAVMWSELEKFAEIRHRILWRMYFLEILARMNRSNSYSRKEYHWRLDIQNPLLTNPKSEYYFPDLANEIIKRREENKAFLARLEV